MLKKWQCKGKEIEKIEIWDKVIIEKQRYKCKGKIMKINKMGNKYKLKLKIFLKQMLNQLI